MTSDDGREMTPTERKWMAAVFVFFGMFMLAMAFGWIKTEPSGEHTPPWVVVSAGMMFNLGGVLILLVDREGVDALRNLVMWLFVLSLALPFNWVAFGEGERHFSGSFSGFGLSIFSASTASTGRMVFGAFALLMDFMVLWPVIRLLRGKTAFGTQEKP